MKFNENQDADSNVLQKPAPFCFKQFLQCVAMDVELKRVRSFSQLKILLNDMADALWTFQLKWTRVELLVELTWRVLSTSATVVSF